MLQRDLKKKIDELKQETLNAQREGNLARAGEINYDLLPKAIEELKSLESNSSKIILKEDRFNELKS